MNFRLLIISLCFLAVTYPTTRADERPNVLFIAIDDLNDWVSIFGGHPQAITPNFDRLARQGSIIFANAHCPGPVCGSSRSALLSGFMPDRTGIYGNGANMLDSPLVQTHATLPEYFAKHGYDTLSRGKIYHAHGAANGYDRGQWAFEHFSPTRGSSVPDPDKITSRDRNLILGKPGPPSNNTTKGGSEFVWGPTKGSTEDMSDYQTAKWAADVLSEPNDKPIFLAVGFSKPHLPFHVPQEFYDLYPLDQVKVTPIREDDLDDILRPDGKRKFSPTPDYLWVKENQLFPEVTQAYLACCSFVDTCLGVVLDGLERSDRARNTIVVVWGDHGWHLGEKLKFRKVSPWSEATRVPLIIRTPQMSEQKVCSHPVNLMDLYPTLIDYCGLPDKPMIDGDSMVPLLGDPESTWRDATVTIVGSGTTSICSKRWRYIVHEDGTEEFYDMKTDPQEWDNLILKMTSQTESAKAELAKFLPAAFAKPLPNSKYAIKNRNQYDMTLKDQRRLEQLK